MKYPLTILALGLASTLCTYGEDTIQDLEVQLREGIEEVKSEYRSGLVRLLDKTSTIILYQLDLEDVREPDGNPFEITEGYFEFSGVEFKIKEEKIITGDSLKTWRSGLRSLLQLEGNGRYIAVHAPNTVLIACGDGRESPLDNTPLFHLTFSWENNNFYVNYPFLGKERHLITETGLKDLIMKELPNDSYDKDPSLSIKQPRAQPVR